MIEPRRAFGRLLTAALGAAAALALLPAAAAAQDKVMLGYVGSVTDAAIDIAEAKGYFKEQNMEVDRSGFTGSGDMVGLLAGGRLDVGAGAVAAGPFNAFARGIDIRIVADKSRVVPGRTYVGLAARKDLIEGGQLKTLKDLAGKRVAIPLKGSIAEAEMHVVLKKAGLTFKDITLVEMPFPSMPAALGNNAIDAAVLIDPITEGAVKRGLAARWIGFDEVWPGHTAAIIFYAPHFLKDEDKATRFMIAYLKGVRDYHDAYLAGDKAKNAAMNAFLESIDYKHKALLSWFPMPAIDPDGKVDRASLAESQQIFVELGHIKTPADLDKMIDESVLKRAIAKIGPYKRN